MQSKLDFFFSPQCKLLCTEAQAMAVIKCYSIKMTYNKHFNLNCISRLSTKALHSVLPAEQRECSLFNSFYFCQRCYNFSDYIYAFP